MYVMSSTALVSFDSPSRFSLMESIDRFLDNVQRPAMCRHASTGALCPHPGVTFWRIFSFSFCRS